MGASVGLLVLLVGAAQAQPEEGEALVFPEYTVTPLPRAARAYTGAWHWQRTGPHLARTRHFVALSVPDPQGETLFALDVLGTLWTSEDAGSQWRVLLPPVVGLVPSGEDEEDRFSEAEGLSSDLLSVDEEWDPDVLEEEILDQATRIQEEVDASAIDQLLGWDEDTSGEASGRGALWSDGQGRILVARRGGIWQSEDGGDHFAQVFFDEADWVNRFVEDSSGILVAAGSQGLLASADGGVGWDSVGFALESSVLDLAFDEILGWFAATEEGLLRSANGIRWRGAGGAITKQPLRAVHLAQGNVWVATPTGILRSDDGGESFLSTGRQYLPDTSRLTSIPGSNHLLLSGGDGVWESTDAGIRWRPVSIGLQGPITHDLAILGRGLLAVGETGFYRLHEGTPAAISRSLTAEAENIPPLDVLVDIALRRPGMDPALEGALLGRTALGRLLPEVTLDIQVVDRTNFSADFGEMDNALDEDQDWRAMLYFSWGKGTTTDSGESVFEAGEFADVFYLMRGQLYSVDDPLAVPTAASRLAVDANSYRLAVAEHLGHLYFARQRLSHNPPTTRGEEIRAKVQYELDMQELLAWIDAYTDGSLSRSLEGT
jgi:photosystem II stability/assembly factor-like uncharacterized protein